MYSLSALIVISVKIFSFLVVFAKPNISGVVSLCRVMDFLTENRSVIFTTDRFSN